MSIRFGEIYLYSHNPQKLFGFLSFLLDVEATSSNEDSICFTFQNMNFLIIKSIKKKIDKTKYFSLYVDDHNDLQHIKQTIEFYHYKEADHKFTLKCRENELEFTDPDGRLWKVIHVPLFQSIDHIEKNLTIQM